MDTTPQTPPQDQPATRLPFDVEFRQVSEEFSGHLMASLPELAGIAIVPLWNNKPENVPVGVLRLRNANPPYMQILLAMLERLTAMGTEIHQAIVGQIQLYGRHSDELLQRISMYEAQLQQLEQTTQPQQIDDK